MRLWWVILIAGLALLAWVLAVLRAVQIADKRMRRIFRNPFKPLQVQVVLDRDCLHFLPATGGGRLTL